MTTQLYNTHADQTQRTGRRERRYVDRFDSGQRWTPVAWIAAKGINHKSLGRCA